MVNVDKYYLRGMFEGTVGVVMLRATVEMLVAMSSFLSGPNKLMFRHLLLILLLLLYIF